MTIIHGLNKTQTFYCRTIPIYIISHINKRAQIENQNQNKKSNSKAFWCAN